MVNTLLVSLGLTDEPVEWLLFSDFAVEVGLLASYFPFVIFPILLALHRVDANVLHASRDLGAGFWTTLRLVILPLTLPAARRFRLLAPLALLRALAALTLAPGVIGN